MLLDEEGGRVHHLKPARNSKREGVRRTSRAHQLPSSSHRSSEPATIHHQRAPLNRLSPRRRSQTKLKKEYNV